MPELLGLSYSPWSEKARWALDVRKVAYTSRAYQPLIGELALRRKLGRWRGIVSVPVLTTDDGRVLADSAEIARWADGRGDGPTLFPAAHDAEIDRYVALSERGLGAGRALSLMRLVARPRAVLEMVPRPLRSIPGAPAIARAGIHRTLRKYRAGTRPAEVERELRGVLDGLRGALAAATGPTPGTLLGAFTFADVAMTQVLAFVTPPAFGLRIGKETRESFVDARLSAEYADLLAWRDAVYETYRPR